MRTHSISSIFWDYKVKATFFVVGDWVDKYPEFCKGAFPTREHEIRNHSNKHKQMPQLSRDDIISDITACNQKIEKNPE
jgi:peptidoglycan/xylan/chitin deacetylase (PgdA/CDA1 family)